MAIMHVLPLLFLFSVRESVAHYRPPYTETWVNCRYGHQLVNGKPVPCTAGGSECGSAFFCKTAPYSSVGQCCLAEQETENPCCQGEPARDHNNDALQCRVGFNDCPASYSCQTNSKHSISVCCKPLESYQKCPNGQYYENKQPLTCPNKRFSGCPVEFDCHMGPNNSPGPCCHVDNPCSDGQPYRVDGYAVHCGAGRGRQDCPTGYSCVRSSGDSFTVCCPEPSGQPTAPPEPTSPPEPTAPPEPIPTVTTTPVTTQSPSPAVCEYGTLMTVSQTIRKCRVATHPCPSGYTCTGETGYHPGVCCLDNNPCSRGVPHTSNGNAVSCITASCPAQYECVGDANGNYAVCCLPELTTLPPTTTTAAPPVPPYKAKCYFGYYEVSGNSVPCSGHSCPDGYYCNGVCCLDSNRCPQGEPFRRHQRALSCGKYSRCPPNFICHRGSSSAGGGFSICCPIVPVTTTTAAPATTTTNQPPPPTYPPGSKTCFLGTPYIYNKVIVHCSSTSSCPKPYKCMKNVCCKSLFDGIFG